MSYYSCMALMMQYANLSIMSVIFTSIFACEDHARGTEKTIFALGFSRTKIFFARFLASAVGTLLLYSVVMIFGFLASLCFGSEQQPTDELYTLDILSINREDPNIFLYALQQLFIIMALHAFYFMFAELVKKTGFSIVLGVFVPGMVLMLVGIAFIALGSLFHDNTALTETLENIFLTFSKYWLPSSTSSMIGFFTTLAGVKGADIFISMAVNTGYIILFGGLALLITNKKEIKG